MNPGEQPAAHHLREPLREAARVAEEIANALTHGLGLALSVVGLVVLVPLSAARGTTTHLVACAVYGATLVLLYAASTLYHSFQRPRLKRLLRRIDHAAIYLLIAGTYTPFALVNLRGGWGWALFGVAWGMAAFGVVYKLFFMGRLRCLSTSLYLVMGWMAVAAAKPFLASVAVHGLLLLAVGGLLYTAGVWFYVRDHRRYHHAVWHLFVLGGSACHYAAVVTAVLPA